jgi:hypothetical protein
VVTRSLVGGATGGERAVAGLFAATPLALLGLLRGPWPAQGRSRVGPACAAAGGTLIVLISFFDLEAHAGGLQLGSRYLLPAAPLLLVGAAALLREHPRTSTPAALVLGALSIAATAINLRAEARLRAANAQVMAAIATSPAQDIVTTFGWAPQMLAPLYLDKRIYLGSDDQVLARMVEHGTTEVVRVHAGLQPHRSREVSVAVKRILLPPQQVIEYSLAPPTAP